MEMAAAGFNDLEDETLALVLSFSAARDVEALTVASRLVALEVLPRFPSVWRALFCRRWETLNFPLQGVRDGSATLHLSPELDAMFPASCSTSRKYQLLAHAVTPVPSTADLARTRKSLRYSDTLHRVVSLDESRTGSSRTVDFAFDGNLLGNDRTVRANVPFSMTLHVAVYCRRQLDNRLLYEVGVVSSGYYEYTITRRAHAHMAIGDFQQESMTAIGIVADKFPLVGRQPGWRSRSYGYHGDDGRFFDASMQGETFGPRFGAGNTVGCGVRNVLSTGQMFVFFTKDGQLITDARTAPSGFVECSQRKWYPAVGLDSYDHIHINFGQEPFMASEVVGQLFSECRGHETLLPQHLQWYDIRDSDVESDSEFEDEPMDEDDSDNELMLTDVTAFILRALERRRERPPL